MKHFHADNKMNERTNELKNKTWYLFSQIRLFVVDRNQEITLTFDLKSTHNIAVQCLTY